MTDLLNVTLKLWGYGASYNVKQMPSLHITKHYNL